ncbi:Pyrokinin [Hexamita inflata]|uniref:Conserved site n=1 Tax=Hexamita inflata TaxID=28002 RepID=A0AA86NLH0_9EUKA|nr:Pyrokinin [Hexamita inflata]
MLIDQILQQILKHLNDVIRLDPLTQYNMMRIQIFGIQAQIKERSQDADILVVLEQFATLNIEFILKLQKSEGFRIQDDKIIALLRQILQHAKPNLQLSYNPPEVKKEDTSVKQLVQQQLIPIQKQLDEVNVFQQAQKETMFDVAKLLADLNQKYQTLLQSATPQKQDLSMYNELKAEIQTLKNENESLRNEVENLKNTNSIYPNTPVKIGTVAKTEPIRNTFLTQSEVTNLNQRINSGKQTFGHKTNDIRPQGALSHEIQERKEQFMLKFKQETKVSTPVSKRTKISNEQHFGPRLGE